MPEEGEEGKLKSVRNFFSRVGKAVGRMGKATTGTPTKIKKAVKSEPTPKKRGDALVERLRELDQLESMEAEMEEEGPRWEEEEEEWEERSEELKSPVSERATDIFSRFFMRPAKGLTGFFSGLDDDLRTANMDVSEERYLSFLLGVGSVVSISAFLLVWFLMGAPILALLLGFGGFLISVLAGRAYPKSKISGRASEVNQQIPYALRHMAAQLSSGIGLSETMTSVSKANYGALSEEFSRAIQDMRKGDTMNESLSRTSDRVDSDFLNRAIRQIQRTLRVGGDLSKTLNILAEEASATMRMNLRNYTQSLNMMSMIYMFASAIIPSMLIVVMIVMNFMGGGLLPPEILPVLYLLIIPFLLFYLVILFKRMEPEV